MYIVSFTCVISGLSWTIKICLYHILTLTQRPQVVFPVGWTLAGLPLSALISSTVSYLPDPKAGMAGNERGGDTGVAPCLADFSDADRVRLAYVAYLPPVSAPSPVSHTRSRVTKAVTFLSRVEQRPGGVRGRHLQSLAHSRL